jgi:hypothetical protein
MPTLVLLGDPGVHTHAGPAVGGHHWQDISLAPTILGDPDDHTLKAGVAGGHFCILSNLKGFSNFCCYI